MRNIVIIGGGVIGCGVARELSRYRARIVVLEKNNDIAAGTTKANSGIVHAGFDAEPGTRKAKFNVAGNAMFDRLSEELDFPFKRNGAFVLCFASEGAPVLTRLYEQGLTNGLRAEDLEILPGDKVRQIVPSVSQEVLYALHAKTSGIVSPYEMAVAYAENAARNGVTFERNKRVTQVKRNAGQWDVACEDGSVYRADLVVNAAGVYADVIHNQACESKIRIIPRKGEYMLLDKSCGYLTSKTLFQLPSKMGKGILVAPTTHGNVLVGPTARDCQDRDNLDTTFEGLREAFEKGKKSVPELNARQIITQFGGLRAHCTEGDFVVGMSAEGFYDLAGIESPGLTAAPALAVHAAEEIARALALETNDSFVPNRKAIASFAKMSDDERAEMIRENPLYGRVVCRCENVTEGEIVESIHREVGARDLDGVKRRTRAGMGRCQSGFCTSRVMEILARELGCKEEEITKFGAGSEPIRRRED